MKNIILAITAVFCLILYGCTDNKGRVNCSTLPDLDFTGYKGKIKKVVVRDASAKKTKGTWVQDTFQTVRIYNYDIHGNLLTSLTIDWLISDTITTTYTRIANNINAGKSVKNGIILAVDTTRWQDAYNYEQKNYLIKETGASQLLQSEKYILDSNCLTKRTHIVRYNDDNNIEYETSFNADDVRDLNILREKYGHLAYYYQPGNKILATDANNNPTEIVIGDNDTNTYLRIIRYEYYK